MKAPSKICVCLGEIDRKAALEILTTESLCELRLDLMPEIQPLEELFSAGAKCVVTCRHNDKQKNSERHAFFDKAVQNKVYAIDFDMEDPLLADLKRSILGAGIKLILSHHNYSETPPIENLKGIRNAAFNAGANIFKLASKVNTKNDVIHLLSLLEDEREQIIIGMGELGKIVRVTAPYLGSLFTYVSSANAETATGQLDASQVKQCWQILGEP